MTDELSWLLGNLMSFGPRLTEIIHRATSYLARILRGANPGELSVEQPTRFDLVVNLRAARALGVSLRLSLGRRR